MEETIELFAEPARSKGLLLTTLIYPNVPCLLRGDPWRLRQIVSNLVSNAIKFTETGEVRLQINISDEKANIATLNFEVSDTGIGISPDGAERLFQPFSQTDSSMTRKFGGTGLGLVISRDWSS